MQSNTSRVQVNTQKINLYSSNSFNLARPLSSYSYVVVNRTILCNCRLEAKITYLLKSIGSHTDASTVLTLYIIINLAFYHYILTHTSTDCQSAYRTNYSCETTLVKLTSDILNAMEYQRATALVVLDLSAAFDTVDHGILLEILNHRFGIDGSALDWYNSYLQGRTMTVYCNGQIAKPKHLHASHSSRQLWWTWALPNLYQHDTRQHPINNWPSHICRWPWTEKLLQYRRHSSGTKCHFRPGELCM